jgi:serine/threonine protein kinase
MKVCSVCRRCYEDEVFSCTEEGHPSLEESRRGNCELIAGYRLESLIGSGSKGEVYRARRIDCSQSCRIKILPADTQNAEQFLFEAKLAAALFHPSTVDIYEAGSLENGELFVVAEDTGCKTLRDLLNNAGVPQLLTSIQIVRLAAEALHALHLKGLTHRAVRPENIVVSTDPEQRLLVRMQDLDFGGVVEHSIVSNKFLIDSAIDSLRYFAPEQFSGEAVSMKTDVYSIGIVFYEMLAGEPPFDATKAAELIYKHRNHAPPEIKIDNFDLRMLVTHTLTESLHKRPETRQSSANAFARQLRHIEQLATHISTPPPAVVVPSVPPRSAAYAAPMRAPFTRPAAIEHEPIVLIEVESDSSAAAFKEEIEAVRNSVNEMIAIPDLLPKKRVVEKKIVTPASRVSRLKVLRKKLHPKTSPPPPEIATPVATVQVAGVPSEPERTAVPRPAKPAKIEWDQPEDDIPSLADVMEVRAQEHIPDAPVVQAQSEKIALVPARTKPAKVERNQIVASPAAMRRVLGRQAPARIPAVQVEPEEITLVRAPSRRMTIEWENKRADASSIPDEINFFPTIMRDIEKRKTIGIDSNDAIFSAYSVASQARVSVPYRSLMIGGGLTVLIALFLFGNGSVGRYIRAWNSSDPLAATTSSAAELPPRIEQTIAPPPSQVVQTVAALSSKEKELKIFEKPLSDSDNDDTDAFRSKPVARSPAFGERPRTRGVQNVAEMPSPSSTLVIYSDNGIVKSKTELAKGSIDNKPLSGPNRSDGATRPRIVKDPKP